MLRQTQELGPRSWKGAESNGGPRGHIEAQGVVRPLGHPQIDNAQYADTAAPLREVNGAVVRHFTTKGLLVAD
jgi:hypothetical protein